MDVDPIYRYYRNKYIHIPDEYVERMAQKAREQEREHEELELEESLEDDLEIEKIKEEELAKASKKK